jgi:hypothetical protein
VHSTAGTTCCLYHLCVLCASPVSSPQCILTRPCSAAACVRPLCVIFSLAPVPHPWLVSPLCCRPVWRSTGGRRPQPLIGGATKHAAVDLQPLPLHLSPVSTTLSLSLCSRRRTAWFDGVASSEGFLMLWDPSPSCTKVDPSLQTENLVAQCS